MELFSIAGLVALGIILIALEVFFVPGTTLVGVLGFISCLVGVYFGYADIGQITGHVLLGITIVGPVAMFYIGVKFKVWNAFALKESVTGKSNQQNSEHNFTVGMRGRTISTIKPIGSVEIGDKIIEVSSLGEYIDENSEVEIIKIKQDKIFVQTLKTEE